MESPLVDLLRSLLLGRGVAALATLHDGRPFASMVPFAVTTIGGRLQLIAHVSGLAAHTRDMRSNPDVCLMVMAPETDKVPPQALPRVSISGRAVFIPGDHPEHAVLKVAYLGKFPEAADLFQLGDFSIVAIEPVSARFVAGFARAMTLSAKTLDAALHGSPAS
ncbi:MAG: pyridoxamine 5'-phosphate oxidase family protein [Planctomycetes bacterium]|nr:pyridoxamine 5'-phosphate oxidase family protein [Planctomycetota bacterium]